MTGFYQTSQPAILVVTDRVSKSKQDEYEKFVGELHHMLEQQPGFVSVDWVHLARDHHLEYTALLRFEDDFSATNWELDPEIRAKIDELQTFTDGPAKMANAAGLELCADHQPPQPPSIPAFWKRVAVSVAAVYPSLMLLMAISQPFIGTLPQAAQILIIVIVLSALLTWPIMPVLTRILRLWLMPAIN
jgi:antibiotic biosynthesis monooxygenase (ABM) superfamily enzyme